MANLSIIRLQIMQSKKKNGAEYINQVYHLVQNLVQLLLQKKQFAQKYDL